MPKRITAAVEVLMTVPEIIALARDEFGVNIPGSTVRMSMERGYIQGARKISVSGRAETERGGRWHAPEWAVRGYLRQYRPNRDQQQPTSGS